MPWEARVESKYLRKRDRKLLLSWTSQEGRAERGLQAVSLHRQSLEENEGCPGVICCDW